MYLHSAFLRPETIIKLIQIHFLLSSSPKHLLQNVISGIFPSSKHRVYRLEIANFFHTFSHVGIFGPALWSVLSPVATLPYSLVQHYPPSPSLFEEIHVRITWCVTGGGGIGLCWRQVNSGRKVPFLVIFQIWRHFTLPSLRLIFLRFRLFIAVWKIAAKFRYQCTDYVLISHLSSTS
jgi:hypothetical protein